MYTMLSIVTVRETVDIKEETINHQSFEVTSRKKMTDYVGKSRQENFKLISVRKVDDFF